MKMADTTLIVHVRGTEDTKEMPKSIVRAAIAQGQFSRSQLIWSPPHNAWKQVRELPHLLPSQKLAPAPVPRVTAPTGTLPVIAAPTRQSGAVPRIVAKTSAGTPTVAVRVATPSQSAPSQKHVVVEKESSFSFLKWIFIGVALLVAGIAGANYFLVDQPLAIKLGATPYAKVPVYAHLGAFVQPGALVIHIPDSSQLTKDNLVDFLVTLAHSTPQPTALYQRISLTTGLTSHYTLSGFAWKGLGEMVDEDQTQKESYLLSQLTDSAGEPLIASTSSLDDKQNEAKREQAWNSVVTYFTTH